MISDLVDEGVRAISDRDALLRRRLDIDRIDPDAAERDDLAALQPVDHPLGDRPAFGIEGVGVARRADEVVLRPWRNLEDLRIDRRERLHLVSVITGGREAGAPWRRDPELGQNSLPCARSILRSHRRWSRLSTAARLVVRAEPQSYDGYGLTGGSRERLLAPFDPCRLADPGAGRR